MIKTIRKLIRIGSSEGVTLPIKELRLEGFKIDDEVRITVEAVNRGKSDTDQDVIDAAKKIFSDYKQDFQNLANR